LLAQKGTDGTGSGDVIGPSSSTNNNLVAFNGTTGKLIKDSGYSVSSFEASGAVSAHASQTSTHGVTGDIVGTGGNQTITGTKTFSATPKMDSIAENTTDAGVTVDELLIKDGGISGVKKVSHNIVTATNGTTITFDLSQGDIQQVTLGGNRTLAISNYSQGQCFILHLRQDSTGSRTVTWFSFPSTFTTSDVNTSTDVITVGRNIPTGTPIIFTSTGTLPTGLTSGTTYYAINNSSTTIKVASSLANAQAGTAIDITGTGSGTHTIATQIRWVGGSAPTLTSTKHQTDSFGFIIQSATDGIVYGYIVGQNL
jgi:hypothetical protein